MRSTKLSCAACHQSCKSLPNRVFLDCTDPTCGLKPSENATNRPHDSPIPIEKYCVKCLKETFKYADEDTNKSSFVCPKCKGLQAPTRKRVSVARSPRPTKMPSLANVQGELVLLSLASDGNVLLPVPAIRLDEQDLQEYLRPLSPEQKHSAEKLGMELTRENTDAGAKPSHDQTRDLADFESEQTDQATAGMTLVHSGLMQSDGPKRVSPCMLAFTSKANVMAVIRDHHCTQSFEWNQAVVELVLDAATTIEEAAMETSGTDDGPKQLVQQQKRCWQTFVARCGNPPWPTHRVRSFAARRAWKFALQDAENLPNMAVSLEVPACPETWEGFISERTDQMPRLRKRNLQLSVGAGAAFEEGCKNSRRSNGDRAVGANSERRSEHVQSTDNVVSTLSTSDVREIQWCKIAPPADPQKPPEGAVATYKFEADNVVRVDISKTSSDKDRAYIMGLCENPDVTVIIKGLTSGLNQALWTWEYLLQRCGHVVWKKIRSFIRKDDRPDHWHENGWKTMSLLDYNEYLQRREAGDEAALNEVLYWIDFPMAEFLPELAQDFQSSSPLDLFPGGSNCAQRWVTASARPDMGPNLYITPPGGRTWFHEDGNGTVDSGHQCLTGQNEVIMLRRVVDAPTRLNILHKLNAGENIDNARPHDDTVPAVASKQWPTEDTLKHLRDDFHAGPASFVLGPGEFVHINKGRLHAFRKKVPESKETSKDICISVAWDWMFEGTDGRSVSSEIGTAMQNSSQNKLNSRESLAIASSTLMQGSFAHMAKLQSMQAIESKGAHFLAGNYDGDSKAEGSRAAADQSVQRHLGTCAALQPFMAAFNDAESQKTLEGSRFKDNVLADLAKGRADMSRVDAFTNSSMGDTYCPSANTPEGYDCWTCSTELFNLYAHCCGCQRNEYDYNICVDCFKAGRHLQNDKQHRGGNHPCGSKRARQQDETCFCNQSPCIKCSACTDGGSDAPCVCCSCFQFRWRYVVAH